ncbi:MAG TPA: L-histidine N(alpha)-methyltransferase [Planctomycetaceae bacterium]|nr:L-histidine N(alpha)-methyltransferase [Planctomycetaceae bacterium]HBP80871.1 L-histidine N(alpha)-methyltransferase [Planctomycetaceae bacterium]
MLFGLSLRNGVYVSVDNIFECQLENEQVAIQDGLQLLEFAPQQRPLLEEVHEGLTAKEKSLPAKLHYDQRGSMLFEQICEVDEYYITRTELALMRKISGAIGKAFGDGCMLIEPGSGASLKTDLLLAAMPDPAAYVPVDISRDFLLESATAIADRHDIEVLPVWADFTKAHPIPRCESAVRSRAVYFPGSTVGNFNRSDAASLLETFGSMIREQADDDQAGVTGAVVVGFDCKKDQGRMEAAYNDAEGITAEFNFNVIDRLASELGVGLDRDKFSFRADWVEDEGAIVSRLWVDESHTVEMAGDVVTFEAGEAIRMEESHKYTPDEFETLARESGLGLEKIWTDEAADFAVACLRPLLV